MLFVPLYRMLLFLCAHPSRKLLSDNAYQKKTPGVDMSRVQAVTLSTPVWVLVWTLWLITTRHRHPTFDLALVTTTALVVAYAVAVYLNHLLLIPKYLRQHRLGQYIIALATVMGILTAFALAVIRIAYQMVVGPEPDLLKTLAIHFGIDLLGMAVHLIAAALLAAVAQRTLQRT